MNPNDPYLPALLKARAALLARNIAPSDIASLTGATFADNHWEFPALGHTWQIAWPDLIVTCDGKLVNDAASQIVLLNYLSHADGSPMTNVWVHWQTFAVGAAGLSQDRPGYLPPLTEYFKNDVALFRARCEKLGGASAHYGDAAYIFAAFPRIPLLAVYSAGDDEVPASSALLFDRSADHFLPAEDLTGLINWLQQALEEG